MIMVKRPGIDYDSPKHLSFIITNSLYSSTEYNRKSFSTF